jgi:hypothetical protein
MSASAATTNAVRRRSVWTSSRVTSWVVGGAFLFLAGRLAYFLNRYTVNIIYWDQWDFLQGMFDGADAWTLFRWQHGPQRQGLGNLISAVLYPITSWDGRTDAVVSAVSMGLAALAALWLVKRVCGTLRPWDVVAPLLFLTTTNAESYVVAPNSAHGPIPALLLIAYALALTVQSHSKRCALLVVLNFFAVNTGFTLLLGGITPVLLLLFACAHGVSTRDRAVYAAGIVASLSALALFFHGFIPHSATDCFQFPHPRAWEYVPYIGFVLARPFGLEAGGTAGQLLIGSGVAFAVATFATYAVFRVLRVSDDSTLWLVTSALVGFALLFASGSAVGRICLGFQSANASRYIPYILPGMLAMYLVIRRSAPTSQVAAALLPVVLVACITKETDEQSANEATAYLKYKQRWRDCYVAMHNISACDAYAGHGVYPAPQATNLQQKLDWLEERRLNLFNEESPRAKLR